VIYLLIWVLFAGAFIVRLPAAETPAALLQLRLQSNNISILYYVFIVVAVFSNARQLTDESQRRQVRWVAFGVLLALVGGSIAILLPIALNLPLQTFLGISGLFSLVLPIAFAIAIVRENLFDIDLVINRTLIYGPLTALLAVLFALTNSAMNFLLSGLAGEKSQITLVINTLVVILAFNPLKDKLQEIVDRRFKAKPNPAKQLETFAALVRAQMTPLDVPRVSRSFLRTIVEGYGASHARLNLNYGDVRRTVSFGINGGAASKQIPLLVGDVEVGTLDLGARRNKREWTAQDSKAISDAGNILAEEILASADTLK
jgi:hypothetical protein